MAWLAGCGPEEATAGTGDSEGSGSSSATTTATDGGSTPTTMDTSAGTASASDGSSTGTTPADSSGDGPMPTTTPGDTGPSDSSGGSGGTDGTGGGMDGSYPPCQLDADPVCPKPLMCQQPMQGQVNWCAMGCQDVGECPLPSEGTAVPFCGGPNDVCMLDCGGDATCPTGMECVGLGNDGQAMRCVWPSMM